jgi:hypothetical protein
MWIIAGLAVIVLVIDIQRRQNERGLIREEVELFSNCGGRLPRGWINRPDMRLGRARFVNRWRTRGQFLWVNISGSSSCPGCRR